LDASVSSADPRDLLRPRDGDDVERFRIECIEAFDAIAWQICRRDASGPSSPGTQALPIDAQCERQQTRISLEQGR
jgi:hypothetical protein